MLPLSYLKNNLIQHINFVLLFRIFVFFDLLELVDHYEYLVKKNKKKKTNMKLLLYYQLFSKSKTTANLLCSI